jgi:hypothetical protein
MTFLESVARDKTYKDNQNELKFDALMRLKETHRYSKAAVSITPA